MRLHPRRARNLATVSGLVLIAALTVTAGPIATLVVSPAQTSSPAGQSQAFTAEGYDSYGNDVGDDTNIMHADRIPHEIMIRAIQTRAPTRWRMTLLGTSKMQ